EGRRGRLLAGLRARGPPSARRPQEEPGGPWLRGRDRPDVLVRDRARRQEPDGQDRREDRGGARDDAGEAIRGGGAEPGVAASSASTRPGLSELPWRLWAAQRLYSASLDLRVELPGHG